MIDGPSPALAIEAKRLLLVQQAQELFTKRDLAKAPAIIKQAGDLLTANPDDAANRWPRNATCKRVRAYAWWRGIIEAGLRDIWPYLRKE